jgi:hypothetical protein
MIIPNEDIDITHICSQITGEVVVETFFSEDFR